MKTAWLGLIVLGSSCGTSALASLIVPGQDVVQAVAVQSIDLFPGTPFNPSGNTLTVQLVAPGSFVIDRSLQNGSTIDFTLPTAQFQGVLPGPLPPLPFDLLAGTADLVPSIGAISNVVQNPADPGFLTGDPSSFVSGDFSVDAYFKLVIPAIPSVFPGATIYSDPNQAAIFTAQLTSLPPAPGTVFASPARINLYLLLGSNPDPANDLLIGQSFNRTVTAVPEPGSVTLVGIGAFGLVLSAIRRRRPTKRTVENHPPVAA